MGQNEDHIKSEDADPARTVEAMRPLYELGGHIGGYKLLSVLGEGGFGIIYLAEEEHPIKRLAALKVIKPGMDTKEVIARFETERQALALLEHPNIAQVFDAGTTPEGRPYFAMEYVKGIPITEYCDRCKLGTPERLELFIPLCQAIQHAHHKGIIHRDIKPSNVLVMLHDEKPIPKIIDFGVAKALNQRLTERTLVTEPGQLIGTPEYMSPEQAEVTGLDVDTRTDIYSLGVLLYELLTGCTPFDAKELRSKGYAEMQRIIQEQEAVKPSAKLATLGERLGDAAKHRGVTAEQLRRSLRGDLDWIVMKCLEKDRARRYGTAQALAEDIERHLHHLPVSAGSPGAFYRARKFVHRHRTQVVVSAFILAVVLLLTALLGQDRRLVRMQREAQARREALALEEARRSLSSARDDYASGRYAEALQSLQVLVDNKYVGAQARLLRARLALDLPDANVPVEELRALLQEPNDIASQAHLLLAKIYVESRADDDKTASELVRKASEHLQKAEGLASGSADVFLGRALLSDTPVERMEWLNQALAKDPDHVDSLRLRTLAHQASRNYDEMLSDASVLVGKNCPEGYALRAIAWREKAQLPGAKDPKRLLRNAIEDHNVAIERARTQSRFCEERRETYMCLGEYGKALADARACIQLSPEEGIHHFHAFCALTALGWYADAQREYETILLTPRGSSTGDYQFRRWAAAYALDIVDRHAQWHPAGPEPEGAAFAVIRQTVEAHQSLAKKAQCVVHEGYVPTWSPNGDELAYSRGTSGYSAIEVLNPKTGTTRLLCYSGFYPAWSPDGRRIAFVRHRKTVRLQDLTEGKRAYGPALGDLEVWIMNADGTGRPRWLARGTSPSWARDAERLYYHSLEKGGYLCSISIEDGNTRPEIPMPGFYPMISPDEKHVVWTISSPTGPDTVELVALPGGEVKARWIGFYPNWSPDGKSVVFSRYGGRYDGVWIYDVEDVEKGKAAKAVGDWVCRRCSWAPGSRLLALSAWAHVTEPGDWVYSGTGGSIWICPVDSVPGGRDWAALIQDRPRDESDARSLWQMIEGYQAIPRRKAVAEQLSRKLIEVLQEAVASGDPNSIQPVERLADAYVASGRYDDAEQLYRQAQKQLAQHGAKAQSLLDLTEELVRFYLDVLNRCDQAELLCRELEQTRREVLGADSPRTLRTLILLARIYERQKHYQEAEQLYLKILKIQPSQDAKGSTPEVYESVFWRWPFAPRTYFLDEQSLVIRLLEDRSTEITNDKRWMICAHYLLARLYAMCPEAELHKVPEAIEHGTSACKLSNWAEPICLDALAAAYAEAGRFDVAIQRQKEAIVRLSGNKAVMRTVFMNRLALYERKVAKPSKGLVARWEFEQSREGMILDSSGNNLHGRLIGDAQIHSDPQRGHVLRLDGVGDWVDCGTDTRFDITDEITISVWIKVDNFDKAWQAIIAKGNSAWRLQRAQTSNTLEFAFNGVDAREPGTFYVRKLVSHVEVNDVKWRHIAGVYDGRRLGLYVDGELDTFVPADAFSRINTSTDSVCIGMNSGNPRANEWTGLIDDLRLYSYALPPEDIRALHEGKEPSSDKGSTPK